MNARNFHILTGSAVLRTAVVVEHVGGWFNQRLGHGYESWTGLRRKYSEEEICTDGLPYESYKGKHRL